jgi:hypothetical protein
MGLGFFAITKAENQEFSAAATAILVGHVFDIFDGVVARLTRTSSRFGIELDSLADWITFGIAPAFLMYEMVLKANHAWGFAIAVLFVICGALALGAVQPEGSIGGTLVRDFLPDCRPRRPGVFWPSSRLLYDILEIGKPIRSLQLVMNQVPVFLSNRAGGDAPLVSSHGVECSLREISGTNLVASPGTPGVGDQRVGLAHDLGLSAKHDFHSLRVVHRVGGGGVFRDSPPDERVGRNG